MGCRLRLRAPLFALVALASAQPGCSSSDEPEAPRCLAGAFARAEQGRASIEPTKTAPLPRAEVSDVAHVNGGHLIAQRDGKILRAPLDGAPVTPAADVSSLLLGGRVLGIAVAPASLGGDLFVSLLAPSPSGFDHVVERLPRAGDGFDVAARRRVLSISRLDELTVGGRLAFGGDDKLYVPVGDGALQSSALDPTTLYGKVLRLDVSGPGAYVAPPDNPYASGVSGRPEVWALGFRDPGRPAFDVEAQAAFIVDVGEAQLEINRLVRGESYGWPTRDGRGCRGGAPACPSGGERAPEMSRPWEGPGPRVAEIALPRGADPLRGHVVLLDRAAGVLELVDPIGPAGASAVSRLLPTNATQIVSAEVSPTVLEGDRVATLSMSGAKPAGAATSLVATGCAGPNATPGAGALAYDVASPLWSDGAEKRRWVFLPPGAKIGVRSDGDLDIPVGAVVVKTFIVDGKNIETRLLVHAEMGTWDGYAYEWRIDQSDADLLAAGKTKRVGAQKTWTFPSRVECTACHTAAAGFTLGLELRQLGKAGAPDRFGGLAARFATPVDGAQFPAFSPAEAAEAPAVDRARAYLHANCASCHRPGATPSPALIDLRYGADLRDMDVCAPPLAGDLGVTGARIVSPGDPSRSVLSLRMRSAEHARMPKLGSRVVDRAGADVVDAWITSVACP